MSREVICSIKHIVKKFPGVVALNDVSFDICRGEVHAVVGENGAGKSTLMNVLSGVYLPDGGSIEFDGKPVEFHNPREAQATGIAMIHQELSLSPHMTAAENVFINRMPKKNGFIDKKEMNRMTEELLHSLGVNYISPRALVSDLTVSEQQLLEIVKALSLNAKMLIMDEPTSSLTKAEVEFLLGIVDNLRKQEVSVLYISHKLEEILQIADTITVMRDSQHIITSPRAEMDEKKMVNYMVGREFSQAMERDYMRDYEGRTPILEVRNISDYSGKVKNVSFKLYPGEVLGLTGLVGAGRSELLQCIFGANKIRQGEVLVDGKPVRIRSCRDAIDLGMALIPEGRKIQGLYLKMNVEENMVSVYQRKCTTAGFLHKKHLRETAAEYRERLNVKTPSLKQGIVNLSGGNQQKAIVARWLMNEPRILFMDEPTHGIDIGAKSEIYKIIDDLAKRGISVVLLSSELPEVLTMCDRIMVMHHGELRGQMMHDGATQVGLMSYTLDKYERTQEK